MMKWMKWGVMSVALSTIACGDPVIGVWTGTLEDEEEGVTTDIELTLEKGGDGQLVTDLTGEGFEVRIDWDVEWEKTTKGEYELDTTCASVEPAVPGLSCDTFEIGRSKCVLNSNKEKLTCTDLEGGEPMVLEAK